MADIEQRWQQLRSYYEGFWATWLLHVGRELGIFQSLITTPEQNTATLAQALGFESEYVEVWCKAALAYDFLECSPAGYWHLGEGWETLLTGSGAWGSTYVQLSNRVYETLEAVFRGRALPESSLNLRLHLAQGLKASYNWLWLQWAPTQAQLHHKLLASKRLIEFGCGFGLGLEVLRQAYPHLELTGLEWDFDCAREAERATRAVVVVGSPEEISYRNRFDLAVFHRALSLCQNPREALQKAVGSLRKGGLIIIVSESELPPDHNSQTTRLRLGERFFYQMFHSNHALRSISLDQVETWLHSTGMRTLGRNDVPIGGSPVLVLVKN